MPRQSKRGGGWSKARPVCVSGPPHRERRVSRAKPSPPAERIRLRRSPQPRQRGGEAVGFGSLGVMVGARLFDRFRSEEHTSELQSLMRIPYAVFCLKKHKNYIKMH